jgi:hypothetical protein
MYCKGEVVKRKWEQKLTGGHSPPGTYIYYECSHCGFRYSTQEVKTLAK